MKTLKPYYKYIILLVFLIFSFAFASTITFIEAELDITVDKPSFNAGENITLKYVIANKIPVPAVDVSLVFQLTKSDNMYPTYPPHMITGENTVKEIVVKDIHLRPKEIKSGYVNLTLPDNISPGYYRVDGYAKAFRSPMRGIPFIYFAGTNAVVKCKDCRLTSLIKINNSGIIESLYIERQNMTVAGIIGQVGRIEQVVEGNSNPFKELEKIGVKPQTFRVRFIEDVFEKGKFILYAAPKPRTIQPFSIPVINDGPVDLDNVTLQIDIYNWDDTEPESALDYLKDPTPVFSKLYGSWGVKKGEMKELTGELTVPFKPSAYTVVLRVFNHGKQLSILRSRIDVYGIGSRIAALMPNSYKYNKNDKIIIRAVVLSPADGISEARGVQLLLKIIDDDTGEVVYEDNSKKFDVPYSTGYWDTKYNFTSPKRLRNFTIHASLFLGDREIDRFDVHMDKIKFPTKLKYVSLKTLRDSFERKRFRPGQDLTVDVTLFDEDDDPIEGVVDIYYVHDNKEDFLAFRSFLDEGTWTKSMKIEENWLDKDITIIAEEVFKKKKNSTKIQVYVPTPTPLPVPTAVQGEVKNNGQAAKPTIVSAPTVTVDIYSHDIDNDGIINDFDLDIDGDGIANEDDKTPRGIPPEYDIDKFTKRSTEAVLPIALLFVIFLIFLVIISFILKRRKKKTIKSI